MTINSLYKEILPSTEVNSCCQAHLFSHHEVNLVIGKNDCLEIYYLESSPNASADIKLIFHSSHKLFGILESIVPLRLPKRSTDVLFLSFREAKASVVEYDPLTHSLSTISLHYYEDDVTKRGYTQVTHLPLLRKDPNDRCVAMQLYNDQLAILKTSASPSLLEENTDPSTFPPDDNNNNKSKPTSSSFSSFIVDLHTVDPRLSRLRDFVFLHGYHEPTFAVLCEPLPTWSPRIPVRTDTCFLATISLDLARQQCTMIASFSALPLDLFSLHAVPRPIGGVLALGTNQLLHCEQSSPLYTLAVNDYPRRTTALKINSFSQDVLALDGALLAPLDAHTFHLALPLQQQREHWTLQLHAAGRSLTAITLHPLSTLHHLSSCLLSLDGGRCLFLGGRWEDCVLWDRTRERVLDRLPVVAPITDMAVSHRSSSDASLLADDPQGTQSLELVCATGHLSAGALAVVRRSAPLFSAQRFEMAAQHHLVAVSLSSNVAAATQQQHYLLTTSHTEKRTLVYQMLSVTSELTLVRAMDVFAVHGYAYNDSLILVHRHGIRVYDAQLTEITAVTFDLVNIVRCDSAQSCIVLLTDEGRLLLYRVDIPAAVLQEIPLTAALAASTLYSAASLFAGDLDITSEEKEEGEEEKEKENDILLQPQSKTTTTTTTIHTHAAALEDDLDAALYGATSRPSRPVVTVALSADTTDLDDMLYGSDKHMPSVPASRDHSVNTSNTSTSSTTATHPSLIYRPPRTKHKNESTTPLYLWTCSVEGHVDLYTLPDQQHVFRANALVYLPQCAQDSVAMETRHGSTLVADEEALFDELRCYAMHTRSGRVRHYVVARTRATLHGSPRRLIVYRIEAHAQGRLGMALVRHSVRHPLDATSDGSAPSLVAARSSSMTYIRMSEDCEGVVMAGEQPLLLAHTASGTLYDYTVACAPMLSVTALDNTLLYLTQDTVHVSHFDMSFEYTLPCAVKRVPLGQSIHKIAYHPGTRTHAVLVSRSVPYKKPDDPRNRTEDSAGDTAEQHSVSHAATVSHLLPVLSPERVPHAMIETFQILLVSPETWSVIDSYVMPEAEQVLCLSAVYVASRTTYSGEKCLLAAGTSASRGEDFTCRGRVVLLDVIDVVPEPGRPETRHKLKVACDAAMKGPVTALCAVQGHLAVSFGMKIMVNAFDDDARLIPVAFLDLKMYVIAMSAMKEFLVLGDAYKSVVFVRYRYEPSQLTLLGQDDAAATACLTVDLLVDDHRMSMVMSSAQQRALHLLTYSPDEAVSLGGKRLLRRAEFHVGSHVSRFQRLPSKQQVLSRQHLLFCGTWQGGVGVLVPVTEEVAHRLAIVQGRMYHALPHACGLNPKAYRLLPESSGNSDVRSLVNRVARKDRVLDGDLMYQYWSLNRHQMKELALAAVTSSTVVERDLQHLLDTWNYF